MLDKFILDFKTAFSSHIFEPMYSSESNVYVEEITSFDAQGHTIKRTILSESEPKIRHFKAINNLQNKIAHICIDGDFIPHGKEKYDRNSASFKDGRPDSIIFSENIFAFLELKVEQKDTTFDRDNTQWKRFIKGVTQIEDFIQFLRSNSIEVKDYFSTVYAVVCMRFEPIFKSNSRRNTELFKRSMALGFPVIAHNHQNIFKISY